jgi:glycosyltransferase involved in cell wall biosynthesis
MPDALGEVPHVTLHPPIGDYPGFLEYKISRQWDIGLAPMTGGLFEACKTNNKYREYGGCRVAGVYSATSPYVECVRHGETGLLVANDPEAWIAALEALIDAPALRAAIADRAFEDVRRNYNQASSARQLREVLARLAD